MVMASDREVVTSWEFGTPTGRGKVYKHSLDLTGQN